MIASGGSARANYDVVIFDLDGTLIDSRIGIHSSVVHTLKEMGVPQVDQTLLSRFIGPPLIDSFQNVCGMSEPEAERAVAVYKDFFAVEGIKGFEIYDGVREMLWLLRASGVTMGVATTKDEVFAREIVLNADLLPFFSAIIGSDRDGRMLRKPELIAAALSALGVMTPEVANAAESRESPDDVASDEPRIVMVGDHALDILGAKANGIASIAVTYGFGSDDELREAEPDAEAASVTELRQLLLGA